MERRLRPRSFGAELRAQLNRLDQASGYRKKVEELTSSLAQGLDSLEFDGRRELLRLLVDEVVYDDGHLSIKTILPMRQLHPASRV